MKKILKRVTALAICLMFALSLPLSMTGVDAAETKSYTYNYDYWGDVQESPDFYTVCKVFTGADLGLDTNLNSISNSKILNYLFLLTHIY